MRWVVAALCTLAGCATTEAVPSVLVPREDLQHQNRMSKPIVPGEIEVAPAEVPWFVRAPESLEVWVRPEDLPGRMRARNGG